jgi:hypothetical protein
MTNYTLLSTHCKGNVMGFSATSGIQMATICGMMPGSFLQPIRPARVRLALENKGNLKYSSKKMPAGE